MTNFKKVFAFILVVCMVLSMGTVSFAETVCPEGCTKATKNFVSYNGYHVGTCDHGIAIFTEDCVYDDIRKMGRSYCDCGDWITCEIINHESVINAMEWETDGTKHWKECEKCGYYEEGNHSGTNWAWHANIAKTGVDYDGVRTCEVCNYTETCKHENGFEWKKSQVNNQEETHHNKVCVDCKASFFLGEHDIKTDTIGNDFCTKCDYKKINHVCEYTKKVPVNKDNEEVDAMGSYTHSPACSICGAVKPLDEQTQQEKGTAHQQLIESKNAAISFTWDATNKVHIATCAICGPVATVKCSSDANDMNYVKVDDKYCALVCKYGSDDEESNNYCGNVIKTEHVEYNTPADGQSACVTPTTCKNCGTLLAAAPGHTEKVTPAVAANCKTKTKGWTEHIECLACGTVIKQKVEIDWDTEDVHNYVEVEDIKGDCYTNGKIRVECTICGDGEEIVIDHETDASCHEGPLTFVEYAVENGVELKPDCDTAGKGVYKCEACGIDTIEKEIKKLGHEWGQIVIDTENADPAYRIDCTTGVWGYIGCVREDEDGNLICGDQKPGTVKYEVEPGETEHDWKKVGTVEGTCTAYEGTLYECKNEYCEWTKLVLKNGDVNDVKYNEEVNEKATGHDLTTITENGQIEWPESLHIVVDATCQKAGYEMWFCPVCGVMIEEDDDGNWVTADEPKPIAKVPHSNSVDPKDAKYTDETTDAEMNYVAHGTGVDAEDIDHGVPGWDYTAATCKTRGYWESTCKFCGENYRKIYDDVCVGAHEEVEGKFVGEVVCGEMAYVEILCKHCGEYLYTKTIEELDHDLVLDGKPMVEPTCNTPGKGYVKCTRCDYRTFDNEIEPTGKHEFTYMELAADCNNPHRSGWFCVFCGIKKPDTEPTTEGEPLGCDWETVDSVKFCGLDSYTLVQQCKRCGAERFVETDLTTPVNIDVVKANDAHQYAGAKYTNAAGEEKTYDSIVIKKADCLNDGLILNGVCLVCGLESDDAEYVYIEGEHKAPEGTIAHKYCNGTYEIYECTVCLENIVEKVDSAKWTDEEDLAVLENHFPKAIAWDVVIANSCTTEGVGTPYCTICGWRAEKTEVIPAAHTPSKSMIVLRPATCEEEGLGYYPCTVCGEECDYETIKTVPHTFARFVLNSNDCELPSYVVYQCTVCGAKATTAEELKAMKDAGVEDYLDSDEPVVFKYWDEERQDHITIDNLETVLEGEDNVLTATHQFGEEEYREADCLLGAGIRHTCKKCGYEEFVDEDQHTDGLGHDEYIIQVAANCYVDGFKTVKCFRCGALISDETIYSTGHNLVADEDDARAVAATCHTTGIDVLKCANGCGYEELAVTGYDFNNHVWTTVLELQAMDCKTNTTGMALQKCALCTVKQQVRSIPVEHDWDEGVVTDEPDCVNEGLKTVTCTVCGKTKTVEIPVTKHNMVTISQPADCDLPAMLITKCEDCDLVTTRIKVGSAALGHLWSDETFVPADCFNNGGMKKECLREGCDAYTIEDALDINGNVAYPALNHKGKKLISTIKADCKNPYEIPVYLCPICNEEVEGDKTYKGYGEHSWKITSDNADEITCKNPAFADRECTVCGVKQTNRWTTVDCVMSDYVYSVDYIYRFCLVCGRIESTYVSPTFTGFAGCTSVGFDENGNKILIGEHKGLVVKAGKEGSCTEAGQIEHIECTVCGTVIQQGAVIPAHNTVATPAVAADCINVGYTAGVYCNDCKEYVSGHEEIPALGHKPVEVPAVDATITTPGYTAGVQCSVCGEWLEGHELVAQKDAVVLRLCTVRSKPADFRDDSESKVVNMLEKGTEVQITGALVNEYYPVAGGYIHMNYLGVAA